MIGLGARPELGNVVRCRLRYFETIIQIGLYAIVGLFLSDQDAANPFAPFMKAGDDGMQAILICYVLSYAIATSLIGPIYIACSFTLYLNRRATWKFGILKSPYVK